MIYLPKSRFQLSHELPVYPGGTVAAEGQCLVSRSGTAGFGVEPSGSSNSNQNFVGFSVSDMITLASFPKVDSFVVTGGVNSTVDLSRTPQASSYILFAGTTALTETTDYTLSGKTVTWVTNQAGKTITAVYRYAPTVVEAQMIQGDIRPGGAPGALLGQVGVAKSGVIYTSQYDTAQNYTAANVVLKTGANGRVTIGGSGLTIRGWVIQAPHANGPDGAFLGIEFSAD